MAPAAALLLGLAAFAMVEWVPVGADRDPNARGGEGELGLWQLLIAGEVVVWALLTTAGWRTLRTLDASVAARTVGVRPRWRYETASFLLFTYGAVFLVLGLQGAAGLGNPTVLPGQQWKNVVLHVVAAVAIFPFLVALKRIQLVATSASWSVTGEDVELIHLLRRHLQTATVCLGVIVALAVLATGALRNAVAAAHLTPLPDTYVLVYGAWFTGIVAGIYLYVFGAVEARARWIVDQAAPPRDANLASAEDVTTRGELRGVLSEELELGGDARKNLEGVLAVFSPLIGALLSRLGGI